MTGLDFVALFFSCLSLVISIFSLIELKAMQRSTHKVQFYNPASQEFEKITQAQADVLQKDVFDNI